MIERGKVIFSLWPLLFGSLVVGLLIYFGRRIDFEKALETLRAADIRWLFAGLFFVGINQLARSLRLSLLVGQSIRRIFPLQSLCYLFGSVTPARTGELIKIAGLRNRHGMSGSSGACVLVMERSLEFLALVLLASPVAFIYLLKTEFVKSSGLISLVLIATSVLTIVFGLSYLLWQRFSVTAFLEKIKRGVSRRNLALSFSSSFGLWLFEGLIFACCLMAVSPGTWTPEALFFLPSAIMVGAVSGLPLGLGAFDLTMTLFLQTVGVSAEVVVSALLCYRALSALLPLFLGLGFLPWQRNILAGKPSGPRSLSIP